MKSYNGDPRGAGYFKSAMHHVIWVLKTTCKEVCWAYAVCFARVRWETHDLLPCEFFSHPPRSPFSSRALVLHFVNSRIALGQWYCRWEGKFHSFAWEPNLTLRKWDFVDHLLLIDRWSHSLNFKYCFLWLCAYTQSFSRVLTRFNRLCFRVITLISK